MRSTASPPAIWPAAFLILLFFRLLSVSTIKRVRELRAFVSWGSFSWTIWMILLRAVGSSCLSCCPESSGLSDLLAMTSR